MAGSAHTTIEDEASSAIAVLPPARLGFLLCSRRKGAGIGLRAAAQAVGIGHKALKDIESGHTPVDVGVLVALLECYGVPAGEFVPPRRPLVVTNPEARSGEVLRTYVDAVRTWRNAGRKEKLAFRADDLRVLSELLGTDPDEIERRLIELTGCSRGEARVFRKLFLAALITIPVATSGLMAPAAAAASTTHSSSAAIHHRVESAKSGKHHLSTHKRHQSATEKHHLSTSKTTPSAEPAASSGSGGQGTAPTGSTATPAAAAATPAAAAQASTASGSAANASTPTAAAASQATNASGSAANAGTTPSPAGIPGDWNLKLDSEFTGSSLDTSIWHTGWFGSGTTAPVNHTGEADCYSPNNVTFPGDGSVHLKVTDTPSTCGGMTKPDTGAMLSSNPHDGRASGGFEFTHGVVEARVYVPASASGSKVANWPAVWTDGQSWPTTGEDDIMEGLSNGQACFHFHSALGGPGTCVAGNETGWHTFASDWEPGSVTYYYDGVKVGQITTGITDAPMYLLLDNSVATGSTAVAADMQVASVRVWQH